MRTYQICIFGVLVINSITSLVAQQIFLSRLRNFHTSTWEGLGKPVIFRKSGFRNAMALIRFVARREYAALNDARIASVGSFLRVFYVFYLTYGIFAIAIAWFSVRFPP